MTRQTLPTYRSPAKLKVCKETFLPKCCYQMRIGYIACVIYNTPDILRIALEDNSIENLAKNPENHKLRITTNTFVQIAQQCNAGDRFFRGALLHNYPLYGQSMEQTMRLSWVQIVSMQAVKEFPGEKEICWFLQLCINLLSCDCHNVQEGLPYCLIPLSKSNMCMTHPDLNHAPVQRRHVCGDQ